MFAADQYPSPGKVDAIKAILLSLERVPVVEQVPDTYDGKNMLRERNAERVVRALTAQAAAWRNSQVRFGEVVRNLQVCFSPLMACASSSMQASSSASTPVWIKALAASSGVQSRIESHHS